MTTIELQGHNLSRSKITFRQAHYAMPFILPNTKTILVGCHYKSCPIIEEYQNLLLVGLIVDWQHYVERSA